MFNLLKIFMKNRLRLVIEALKEERKVFSDSDFADMIGKSKSFLSDMLSGNKKISRRTAESVCEAFPEINFKWLLTGEGDMFVASDNGKAPHPRARIEMSAHLQGCA